MSRNEITVFTAFFTESVIIHNLWKFAGFRLFSSFSVPYLPKIVQITVIFSSKSGITVITHFFV